MRLDDFYNLRNQRRCPGFRVSFERSVRGGWLNDMIPARDEPAIADEELAWKLATEVALVLSNAVNIYVIRGDNFTPVKGYQDRQIRGGYGKEGVDCDRL